MKQLEHLQKWYWSPNHPATYNQPHPETGSPAGLGKLMQNNSEMLPAFNLTWHKFKHRLHTWDGQQEAVMYCVQARKLMLQPAEGGTLGELSCLLSESDFVAYCKANGVKLNLQPVK